MYVQSRERRCVGVGEDFIYACTSQGRSSVVIEINAHGTGYIGGGDLELADHQDLPWKVRGWHRPQGERKTRSEQNERTHDPALRETGTGLDSIFRLFSGHPPRRATWRKSSRRSRVRRPCNACMRCATDSAYRKHWARWKVLLEPEPQRGVRAHPCARHPAWYAC